MKSLDTYIREQLKKDLYKLPESKTWEEFCTLNNFNDDTVTEDAIEFFYEFNINSFFGRHDNSRELIFETLKSHNTEALINKINKEFKDNPDFLGVKKYDHEGNSVFDIVVEFSKNSDIILNKEINKDSETAKQLLDILTFFRYYVTLVYTGGNNYQIEIEPSETKNVLHDIQKAGNIVYHVTAKENVSNILKRGLVPKTSTYRYYPERIYLLKNKKDTGELKDDIIDVIRDKHLFPDKYAILKIDLHHFKNIHIYVDPAYSDEEHYYTYENIPAKFIDKISLTDL